MLIVNSGNGVMLLMISDENGKNDGDDDDDDDGDDEIDSDDDDEIHKTANMIVSPQSKHRSLCDEKHIDKSFHIWDSPSFAEKNTKPEIQNKSSGKRGERVKSYGKHV